MRTIIFGALMFVAACGGTTQAVAPTSAPSTTTTTPVPPIVGSSGERLCEALRRLAHHEPGELYALNVGRQSAAGFRGDEFAAASATLDGFGKILDHQISEAQELRDPLFNGPLASLTIACSKIGVRL